MNSATPAVLHGLFAAYPYWARVTLAAVAVLAVAYLVAELVARVLSGLVDRVNQRVPGDVTHRRTTRAGLRVGARHRHRSSSGPS